jgi:hypothetical protein
MKWPDKLAQAFRPGYVLRTRPRRRPRPRIWPPGVMECWSFGVLRQVGIAPLVRGVGGCFQGEFWAHLPRPEGLGCSVTPFHGEWQFTSFPIPPR